MNKYNEIMENITVSKDMRDRILANVEKEIIEDIDFTPVKKKRNADWLSSPKVIKFGKFVGTAASFLICAAGIATIFWIRNYKWAPDSSMNLEEAAVTAWDTAFSSDKQEMATEEMANETMVAGVMAETESATESAQMDDYSEAKEFSSLAKMSREAGTSFKEIQYLDSFSSGKDYYLYNGNVAFISYDVEGNRVIVREMDALYGDSIPEDVGASKAGLGSSDSLLAGDIAVNLFGNDELYTIAEWSKDGLIFQLESSEALTYEDMKELMEFVIQ